MINIVAIIDNEKGNFSQHWVGAQIHKNKLNTPDQLAGFDFILICPECKGCKGVAWPKKIHDWKQKGKIQGDLILATYKGWHWAHLPLYSCWVTHGGTRVKGGKSSLRNSFFIPLPLDGSGQRYDTVITPLTDAPAFCGGRQDRDFKLANDACKKTKQECNFVSDVLPPEIEGVHKKIPLEEYIKCIKESCFTIVSLIPGDWPHGHCDVARSLALGKPVLCTKNSSCDNYIQHKINGYLADHTIEDHAKGIEYIRKNITSMTEELRKNPYEYRYKYYIQKIQNLCEIKHKALTS